MKLTPLITEKEISKKIKELGAEITKKYKGKELVVVGVLKGSYLFFADLIREIDLDIETDFCALSSYHGTASSGEVKITLDMQRSIKDKHVLIVEDIVDTGLTMSFLRQHCQSRQPKSIAVASLLFKPEAVKVETKLDYVGFKIPNDFVVGFGLDYQGQYRHLPYIAQVQNIN